MTPQALIEFLREVTECGAEMRRKSLLPTPAAEPVSTRHYHSDGDSAGSILDLMGSH